MDRSPIRALGELGQSVWCDEISRTLIESGRLRSLVSDIGVTGLSSNPAIFQRAIASDEHYGPELGKFDAGFSSAEAYERLVLADIQAAADILSDVYQESRGADGYASLEVAPALAHDTAATIVEARRLLALVSRPNAMIKIPATSEGVKAVEVLLAEGISVDVTLIFGLRRYAQVIEAYLAGLQRASDSGRSLRAISSVASIFISRVDSAVDVAIQRVQQSGMSSERELRLCEIAQMAGIANARLAYEMFDATFGSTRFATLRANGALPQRICWSSVGTKNPLFADVKYVEALIAENTVTDLPVSLIDAFLDHGRANQMNADDVAGAKGIVKELEGFGIDMEKIASDLERSGLKLFANALADTLSIISQKRRVLGAPHGAYSRLQT
jgi:transaldolase/transaldolase/glucose-6-phosphate isomerase